MGAQSTLSHRWAPQMDANGSLTGVLRSGNMRLTLACGTGKKSSHGRHSCGGGAGCASSTRPHMHQAWAHLTYDYSCCAINWGPLGTSCAQIASEICRAPALWKQGPVAKGAQGCARRMRSCGLGLP